MKNLSVFISLAALLILFAYISFNEARRGPLLPSTRITDESVAEMEYVEAGGPFPAVSLDVPSNVTFAGEPVRV